MATVSAKIAISEGTSVKLGRKTYTVKDCMDQAVAEYEAMLLVQQDQLNKFKFIGDVLLGIRALFPSNKEFGQYVKGTDLGKIDPDTRYGCLWIAENWIKIQKLNKSGKLNTLGISSIRKAVKASEGPTSAGNTSKGKGKGKDTGKAEGSDTAADKPKFQTERELALFVMEQVKSNGLEFTTFAKELADLRKGS
jgi:hypothetical protein